MYKVRTQDSVGKVLIHDVTKIVSDGKVHEKYAVFKKNHVIKEEDIEVLLSIGKEYIYAGDTDSGMVHENDAALAMGRNTTAKAATSSQPVMPKFLLRDS